MAGWFSQVAHPYQSCGVQISWYVWLYEVMVLAANFKREGHVPEHPNDAGRTQSGPKNLKLTFMVKLPWAAIWQGSVFRYVEVPAENGELFHTGNVL